MVLRNGTFISAVLRHFIIQNHFSSTNSFLFCPVGPMTSFYHGLIYVHINILLLIILLATKKNFFYFFVCRNSDGKSNIVMKLQNMTQIAFKRIRFALIFQFFFGKKCFIKNFIIKNNK